MVNQHGEGEKGGGKCSKLTYKQIWEVISSFSWPRTVPVWLSMWTTGWFIS